MYQSVQILASARPKPIVLYDSIVYPFDFVVWGFTFACIMAQFSLLQVMQCVWCKVSGTSNHINYIYEGTFHGISKDYHFLKIIIFQIFFSPLN